MEKLAEIKESLVRARKLAEEVELPELVYRGVDASKLKIDEKMIDILKYIGNGCPNIYYAEDWNIRILPETRLSIESQLDTLINAMEMAGIQENIDALAPEVAAKLKR